MPSYTITDGQNETIDALYPPRSQFDYGNIDVFASGTATMIFTGRGQASTNINLAPGAHLTGTITNTADGTLYINGNASTLFIAAGTSEVTLADSSFNAPIDGTGTFHSSAHFMAVNGPVGSGVTFASDGSNVLSLSHTDTFAGTVLLGNTTGLLLSGLDRPTDYDYANGLLTLYGGGNDHQLAAFRLIDTTPDSPLHFYTNSNAAGGTIRVEGGGPSNGDVELAHHVASQPPVVTNPPPSAPPIVAVHDNTVGADIPDTSSAYSGPVAGITSQFINATPNSLNITAQAGNLFIKTGAGNDAVALHGGTNVVDAGTGSNFLTAAGGFDTFFLDARNIPASSSAAGPVPGAIWDTIQDFGHGDAATLWGIGPGTALVWQKNQGAVGHTGLTLHANLANGSEASLTLAGIDSKAGLSLSYGSSGGSSYLYVKAA